MSAPTRPSDLPEPSTIPNSGWHCSHMFYSIDRAALGRMSADERQNCVQQFGALLEEASENMPTRMQSFVISGHKADFALIMLDPDPLKIDAVHQRLMASPLGQALKVPYSFVSLTEISEYVPSPEQYARRLEARGEDPESPAFGAKVAAYEKRLPMMNAQRLTPELPEWPAMCF